MAPGLHFTASTKKTIPVVPKTVKKPVFSNNALVLYKAGVWPREGSERCEMHTARPNIPKDSKEQFELPVQSTICII